MSAEENRAFAVGQKVVALKNISDAPSGDSPGGTYARAGTVLVIRGFSEGISYPYHVSHEDVLDSTFRVAEDEIRLFKEGE